MIVLYIIIAAKSCTVQVKDSVLKISSPPEDKNIFLRLLACYQNCDFRPRFNYSKQLLVANLGESQWWNEGRPFQLKINSVECKDIVIQKPLYASSKFEQTLAGWIVVAICFFWHVYGFNSELLLVAFQLHYCAIFFDKFKSLNGGLFDGAQYAGTPLVLSKLSAPIPPTVQYICLALVLTYFCGLIMRICKYRVFNFHNTKQKIIYALGQGHDLQFNSLYISQYSEVSEELKFQQTRLNSFIRALMFPRIALRLPFVFNFYLRNQGWKICLALLVVDLIILLFKLLALTDEQLRNQTSYFGLALDTLLIIAVYVAPDACISYKDWWPACLYYTLLFLKKVCEFVNARVYHQAPISLSQSGCLLAFVQLLTVYSLAWLRLGQFERDSALFGILLIQLCWWIARFGQRQDQLNIQKDILFTHPAYKRSK